MNLDWNKTKDVCLQKGTPPTTPNAALIIHLLALPSLGSPVLPFIFIILYSLISIIITILYSAFIIGQSLPSSFDVLQP